MVNKSVFLKLRGLNKIEKCIIALFVGALLLDNINGAIMAYGGGGIVNFSQLVRIIYVLFFFGLYTYAVTRKKVGKKQVRAYLLFVLSSIAMMILPMIYSSQHLDIMGFYMDELYAVKLLYPILIILSLTTAIKSNIISKKIAKIIIAIFMVLVPLSIIVPYVIGLGFNAYSLGGYKGFYFANNEINVVMVCTFIFAMEKAYRNKRIVDIAILAMNAIGLILIGSKTSLMILVTMVIFYSIRALRGPKVAKKNTLVVVFALIITVAVIAIAGMGFLSDIYQRLGYYFNQIVNVEGGSFLDFITSNRSRRIVPNFERNILYPEDGWFTLLFGRGRFMQVYDKNYLLYLIEMDFFDTLFWYGIFAAVGVLVFYISILMKSWKRSGVSEKIAYIVILLFSLLAGHVWYSALAGETFALCATMLGNSEEKE